jgi:thioredoxin reductase
MPLTDRQIAIIGAGPAGIAAAIQLKRYGFEPAVFEYDRPGGLLRNAWKVENYPGFPDGIGGPELVSLLQHQLLSFEIELKRERVEFLDFDDSNDFFVIRTENWSYSFDIVIVASGTIPKRLDMIESFPKLIGQRLFYEIYPIKMFKRKKMVIIGAGDAAFDYALNLSGKNEVIILNRTDRISALPLLVKMARAEENITYCENVELFKIEPDSADKLIITVSKFDKQWVISADYLLAAIGRSENRTFYSENLIKKEPDLQKKKRLYLAGDVKNGLFRQSAIAVGDGVKCAMEIYNFLQTELQ